MSAPTTTTTTAVVVEEVTPAVFQAVFASAEGEHPSSSASLVGGGKECEILRSRLLCNSKKISASGGGGGVSRPISSPPATKGFPGCSVIKGPGPTSSATGVVVPTTTMASTSGGGGGGGNPNNSTAGPGPGGAFYPKCNISVTMSGTSEQLTVITTSVSGDRGGGGAGGGGSIISESGGGGSKTVPSMSVIHQPLLQPKVERFSDEEGMDVKPVISTSVVGQQSQGISGVSASAPTPVPVKTEPSAAVEIPYDRERILNFLTDYWKSKNLQQVTEAQLQTAGVSGVSSADFCPDPQRIVEEALFDLFVEYPMMIDGLPITKRSWAKAFYEKDIIQTSKVLFEALFSEMEMQQCTLNGKKGTPELSAIKMLAILRTAAWMKTKKQDPYSFNTNIPSHNQFPTNEEREKIEKKVFTERRSQANRKITKTGGNGDSICSPSANESSVADAQNQESPIQSSSQKTTPAGENRLSLSEDVRREHMAPLAKIPKLDLDTEVVKQLQMLYADSPEGLIGYLLPDARVILIDGFLIPYDDWKKAFGEASTDFVKAAWTLFKVLFSKTEILNCTLNGKNGTKELCPVKKLAILRAVTWMKENQGAPIDIFTFNVRRPECNCFPSDEDKDKIETKVYTEKRYQACRKLKGQQI